MQLWIGLAIFAVAAGIGGAYANHVFHEWRERHVVPSERSTFRRKSRSFVWLFAVLSGLAALFVIYVMSVWLV